jgi:hypothetical protein
MCKARLAVFFLGAAVALLGAGGAPADEGLAVPANARLRLSTESLELPGGERMGWVGGGLLVEASRYLQLGVEAFGAVRGERGGFITLGGTAIAHWPLTPELELEAGLHVGAGGGRGGLPLAGGGLLVRSHLGFDYRLSRQDWLGFGLSQVEFPSGTIASRQPYLVFQHSFRTLLPGGHAWDAGDEIGAAASNSGPSHRVAAVYRRYRIPAGVKTDGGGVQYPTLDLLGIEWNQPLDGRWYLALEAAGAVGGQSQGYMQILGGLGYRLPLSRRFAASLSAGVGPAGGGAVDTGGGTLVSAQLGLETILGANTALKLQIGEARTPSSGFRARSAALQLGYRFEMPTLDDASPLPLADLAAYRRRALQLRAAVQRYQAGPPNWRSGRAEEPVDNLGFQLDYFVSPRFYLTGQGLAAYAGEAGAYMTGLFGAGSRLVLAGPLFVQAEALLGAAGGGGVAVGSGLVGQAMLGLGLDLSPAWSLLASGGRIQSVDGPLRNRVCGLSLGYRFTAFAR